MNKSQNKARYGSFFQKLWLTLIAMLFACHSGAFAQKTGTLVIYRESNYQGALGNAKIFANGKRITKVGNGRKETIILPVGDYVLQAKPNKKFPVNIKISESETLYVKTYLLVGFMNAKFKFAVMDAKQGKIESDLLKEGSN